MSKKLNEKQKRFAKEYLIDLNATQAAIRAKYSKKTAYSQGQRLLNHVEVQAYIQKLMDKRSEKVQITAENILQDILDTRKECQEHMTKQTEWGRVMDSAAVTGRNKTNELLGRHLKLFTDNVNHTGGVENKVVIVDDI